MGKSNASVKHMSWPNLTDLIFPHDAPEANRAPIGLVGAPLAAGSVTVGRCDLAPALLRSTLARIGRFDVDSKRELATRIADHGDVAIEGLTIEEATGPIRAGCAQSAARHALTLVIGGNNAVTRPALLSLGLALDVVGLITLDAHFDLRNTSHGLGNGNPVRALREDGLPGRNIAQIGLASFCNTAAMYRDAIEGGHLIITMTDVRRAGIIQAVSTALAHVAHCAAIVVDCDIDVIDRGQFPGAPGARPGGMAAHDFFAAVRMLAAFPRVKLIDLTEWDPSLDPSDLSALTAARWVAECVAGFEQRQIALS